jgi:hypothetical protein
MFSEDEIMKYYGVKSWDEVLAMFGEGGKLEGRWGWLQVLREAELGYTVQVMEGWNGGWFHGSVDDITVFAGHFVEQNGRLLVQTDSGSSVVAADMVGLWGDGYYLAMRGSDGTDFAGRQFGANTKYWNPRPRLLSKVDWVNTFAKA